METGERKVPKNKPENDRDRNALNDSSFQIRCRWEACSGGWWISWMLSLALSMASRNSHGELLTFQGLWQKLASRAFWQSFKGQMTIDMMLWCNLRKASDDGNIPSPTSTISRHEPCIFLKRLWVKLEVAQWKTPRSTLWWSYQIKQVPSQKNKWMKTATLSP